MSEFWTIQTFPLYCDQIHRHKHRESVRVACKSSWACLRREPHCSDAHECILHIGVCHTKADLDRLIAGIVLYK